MNSAAMLQMFKDRFKRPATDAAWPDATIYRYLSVAQQQEYGALGALFPRLLMSAPHEWTSADGGLTYRSTRLDSDGDPIVPFGHAEAYVRSGTGYDQGELWGSTYSGGTGDVVFEGSTLRLPQRYARTFSGTVWVRCVEMPADIAADAEPSLSPKWLRSLVVYRALADAAASGGQRDEKPYLDMYARAWLGMDGTSGFLAQLATQYARSHDGALQGSHWWRQYWAAGGVIGVQA